MVDDHAWVREMLSLLLDGSDDLLRVGECSDGSQVLDAVAALQPDVVLMDVHMPAVSGLEATRQLQAAGSRARVIITGSSTPRQAAQQATAAGAAAAVPKGSAPELLLQTIREVAERRQDAPVSNAAGAGAATPHALLARPLACG